MSGRTRGVVFGLGLAAVAAFLVFRGGLFGGATPVPEADGPVAGSPTPVRAPPPQDSTARPSPSPAAMAAEPPGEPTPSGPVKPQGEPLPAADVPVRITIVGLDVAALSNARAYLVGTSREGKAQVVAAAPTPAATVDLVARAAEVAGLSDLRAAVVAPGRPTGWSTPGATGASFEVAMPDGVLLEGGVVDGKGTGIGGLPLVVTSAWGRTFAVYGEDLTFEGSVGRGTAGSPLFFTKTTTDAAGRFAIRVPSDTNVAVLADHEAWILEIPQGGHAVEPGGRRGLVVRAYSAFTVYADIVSASGGTAVPSPLFGLDRGRDGLNFSDVFPTSEVRVTCPRQAPVDRKATGNLRASARGFDPKTEKLLVEPGQTVYRVQLRLEPQRGDREAATIRIDVVDASGRPVVLEGGQKPYLRVRRAEAVKWPPWVADAALTRIDDTILEGNVPEGEWNVQLVLSQHFVWVYATDATLTFASGRQTPWHAVLPNGGPLTIRWGRKQVPALPAVVQVGICEAGTAATASAWSWEQHPGGGTEAVLARWPEGDWVVAVGRQDGTAPRQVVTVKHGVPAVVDFTR